MSAFSPGVFLAAELATDRVRNNIRRLLDQVACGELGVLNDRVSAGGGIQRPCLY